MKAYKGKTENNWPNVSCQGWCGGNKISTDKDQIMSVVVGEFMDCIHGVIN